MHTYGRRFHGAPARRFLRKLLPVLALIPLSATAWGAGQKIGQVSLASQSPDPVNPGSSTTFPASLTRNNNNGSTGSFVATLSYDGFRTTPTGSVYVPGITFVSPPASISFTPKESTKPFTVNVSVASTVIPGTYWFTVTATRTGTSKDVYSVVFPLHVGYSKHGPTAVADSGYFTSGTPIKIPVLANDLPDPNIVPAQPLYVTQIEGVPVKPGDTIGFPTLINATVTVNADGTLTYMPLANLVPGADTFSYTMTEKGDDTPTNNYNSTAFVTVTVGAFPRVTVSPQTITTCESTLLTATGAGGFPPYVYTWTDSSSKVVRSSSATTGADSYTVTVPGVYAVTATDSTGNVSAADFSTVTFDTTGPMISCPSNIIQAADAGLCTAAISPGTASATDNCASVAVSPSRSDGKALSSPYPVGTTTITWTALDSNGRMATCQQTVTVKDMEAPTLQCPADVTVNTDAGQCTASKVALGTPTTSDNCPGPVNVSNDAPASFPKGTTTVTWTATDAAGNPATCTQKVTVKDIEAPRLTCPGDLTISTDKGKCTASSVALGTPTTADNCSGSVNVSNDAPATFPKGTTTVTWTATDASGNQATCTQKVTVNDTEDPTIQCPAAVTVGTDKGQCTASGVDLGTPVTEDNCGVASVSNDAPATFPKGTTTVTWTVIDTSGNKATCTQKVTVKDMEAPGITCPGDITVCAPLGQSTAEVTFPDATVKDNCSGASFAGYDIPSGSTFSLGSTMVTGKAIDAAGNMTTCHFMVTVVPNLTVTITPSDSGTPVMTLTASAGDSYAWTGPDGSSAGTTQSITATTPGTYSVVVTSASGCQGTASITLEAVLRVKP